MTHSAAGQYRNVQWVRRRLLETLVPYRSGRGSHETTPWCPCHHGRHAPIEDNSMAVV